MAWLGTGAGRLLTHFHPVDQFQFFVRGEGKFAGHRVAPGVVHYADRYQPYGPLDPVGEGVGFMTLRAMSDCGVHYMPEAREVLATGLQGVPMPASERRNVTFDLAEMELAHDGWHDVAGSHDDEMAIRVIDVPAGEHAPSAAVGGEGGYLVVVAGGILADGTSHGPGSLTWCPPGAPTDEVEAGIDGTRLGLLQLPTHAS